MGNEIFELKHIFGLKIKEIRQEKQITYQELKEKTGMSISYLSEIENGKKYPKADKIMLLSDALEVPYDELVSLKVPRKLQPIIGLIQSDFFKAFPLMDFGLNPQKLVEIVSQDPEKINAFINTILQISRNFELKQEQFYYAALRSYQELQNNYFSELELSVHNLNLEFPELSDIPFTEKTLTEILLQIGVRVSFEGLAEEELLKDVRSLYKSKERLLLINNGLNSGQKNFLLAREIAFQWLKLKKRPSSTPPIGQFDFEAILNNHKASYFAAALMMPEARFVKDVKGFTSLKEWNAEKFMALSSSYDVTPEMLLQRLTNILPAHFGVKNLFFLRFLGEDDGKKFTLTKELHLSGQHNPHGNGLSEHYCRRWISLESVNQIFRAEDKPEYVVQTQISKYHDNDNSDMCISIAFPNISNNNEVVSVNLGFLMTEEHKKQLPFLNDKQINRREVNKTCERCDIMNCRERAASPKVYYQHQKQQQLEKAISKMS
ncbi:MAG: transcriptional regulator with XRE-family HTH domain [Cyclobacteriaceae bacterium]|jgi:transcriptional regulator with XRE-family HTH domain